jgi:hypothetical protein
MTSNLDDMQVTPWDEEHDEETPEMYDEDGYLLAERAGWDGDDGNWK